MQSGLATKKYSLPLLTTDVFQIAGSLRERVRRLNVKDHLPRAEISEVLRSRDREMGERASEGHA